MSNYKSRYPKFATAIGREYAKRRKEIDFQELEKLNKARDERNKLSVSILQIDKAQETSLYIKKQPMPKVMSKEEREKRDLQQEINKAVRELSI